jgi:hypothetical protein
MNALVKQGNALPTVGYFPLVGPRPSVGRSSLQKPCSGGVWWAREELNSVLFRVRKKPRQRERLAPSISPGKW